MPQTGRCSFIPAVDLRLDAAKLIVNRLDNWERQLKEAGAFEAKSRLGQLLDWVETGEEVVITRRGKVVARLVPPSLVFDRERGRRAAQKIRERRKDVTLGGLRVKDLINEGCG